MGTGETQHLKFTLGTGSHAVATSGIQEVISTPRITRVPKTPPVIAGIANLRGKIVPVLDARPALGMNPDTRTEYCVIFQDGRDALGLLVERVEEIFAAPSELKPVPDHVEARWRPILAGYFVYREQFVFVWQPDSPHILFGMALAADAANVS